MRLLVVEDDAVLARRMREDLSRAGFAVDIAGDGVEGQYRGEVEPYDVVVLDLGLPRRSGLDVLRAWRAAGHRVPVLVLTARDAWHEKVEGFKAGADDYLGKPFHIEELLARVQALVRRASGVVPAALAAGGLALDEDRQRVSVAGGEPVELTATEFRLLRYFMLNPGKVLSKARLAEHIYEYDADPDSNVIEVHVNHLRRKIGRDRIETRRGQGYVFVGGG